MTAITAWRTDEPCPVCATGLILQDDGTLRVRGFIGVPWLGKSQIWTRPSEQLQECKPT